MSLYCTGNVAPVAYLHSLVGQCFFFYLFRKSNAMVEARPMYLFHSKRSLFRNHIGLWIVPGVITTHAPTPSLFFKETTFDFSLLM